MYMCVYYCIMFSWSHEELIVMYIIVEQVLFIFSIVRSQLSESYGEEAWHKLQQAINAVQSSQPVSYSLEELYKIVENSCSHGMSAKLYENLRIECQVHVTALLPEFNQYVFVDLIIPLYFWVHNVQDLYLSRVSYFAKELLIHDFYFQEKGIHVLYVTQACSIMHSRN